MGTPLFGQDISGAVKRAMASGLPAATLRKPSYSAVSAAAPTAAPTVSFRSYPCRGFEEQAATVRRAGTAVATGERVVILIGDTLPAGIRPGPGDRITILGETLEIVGDGVSNDPARATYTCICRG